MPFEIPTAINFPITSVVQIAFYSAMLVFTIISGTAIYSMLRFGKGRAGVFPAVATYAAVSITLFLIALTQLSKIQFQ